MNDEIKEILDYLKDEKWDYYPSDMTPYKVFFMEERDKLLDYITNLQKENEKLKELVNADNESYDIQETIINRQKSELLEQEDYKSRIEKAVEYIKEDYERNQEVIEYCSFDEFYNKLLDILNGKEEKKK